MLIQDSLALVNDVAVRYKFALDTLTCAAKERVEYYRPYKCVIARELRVREVQVDGFPLGAHGLWPTANAKLLVVMGLSKARAKSFSRLLSRRALLYSLDILSVSTRP